MNNAVQTELADDEELYNFEAPTEEVDNVEEVDVEEEEGFELPSKFKGKSPEEIAEAYSELEKAHSRQGQELGNLRKKADDFLFNNLGDQRRETVKQEEPLGFDNLVEDTTGTISKVVDERVKPIVDLLEQTQKEKQFGEFLNKHKDYDDIQKEDAFVEFVKEKSYRLNLMKRAYQDEDLDAADELLSLYKDSKTIREATLEKHKEDATKSASRNSGERTGRSTKGKKTMFKRSDLINLKIQDPAKYESMQKEIDAAYKEGRVI